MTSGPGLPLAYPVALLRTTAVTREKARLASFRATTDWLLSESPS